jgi:RHS repeat-associated protein
MTINLFDSIKEISHSISSSYHPIYQCWYTAIPRVNADAENVGSTIGPLLQREYVNDANGVVCTIDYDYRDWGEYELGWHLKDHLGSTLAIVADPVLTVPPDNPQRVGQRILWTGNYESFGRPDNNVPVCPGAWENPIQFTGYYSDGDVFEHYYAQARYYDPYMGRFLSRDPADFEYDKVPIAINRYPYAGNNPLRYVDPNGEFFFAAIFGFIWEAIVVDIAAYAVVGGLYEVVQGGDVADFVRGFLGGTLIGAVSSFTIGGLTELTAITEAARASVTSFGSWTIFSQVAGSMYGINQMAMLARYGANAFGPDAPFPFTGHHGYWGLLGMGLGVGLSAILPPGWLWVGAGVFSVSWYSTIDDFAQHTVLQNINPTWTSPGHEFWEWLFPNKEDTR